MRPFTDPVLLWLARLVELGVDTETDEPNREHRQSREGIGREGHTVVASSGLGEAVGFEQLPRIFLWLSMPRLERRRCCSPSRARIRLAAATLGMDHRQ